jgi:hypothetical protein
MEINISKSRKFTVIAFLIVEAVSVTIPVIDQDAPA